MLERFRPRLAGSRRRVLALLSIPVIGGVAGAILVFDGSVGAALPDRLSPGQLDCPIHGPLADQETGEVVIDQQVFDEVLFHPGAADRATATTPDAAVRRSPEGALRDYVAMVQHRYPGLAAADFTKIAEESDKADFMLVKDGHVVQVARMKRSGRDANQWTPTAMFGCGS